MPEQMKDNGSAYVKWEVRNGPPLAYVAEKLRHAVEELHDLLRAIDRHVSADLTVSTPRAAFGVRDHLLSNPARAAFYDAVKAYLALLNRLALMDDSSFVDQLARLPRDEFNDWLSELDQSSTLTG